jgi:hypothetical protein
VVLEECDVSHDVVGAHSTQHRRATGGFLLVQSFLQGFHIIALSNGYASPFMNNRQKTMEWVVATLREYAWAPLAVFGFYLFGLAIDLYDRFPFMDIPTHFMGGVTITYFYRGALRNSQTQLGEIPVVIQTLFAFTCTGTTIILWEFYENAFDYLFGTTMVRGLEDTVLDMLIGMAGALALSVFYRRR